MPSSNFQLIPFPVPDYLSSYFAYKLNKPLVNDNGINLIEIDRYTTIGKLLLKSLEESPVPFNKRADNFCYLKISNHSGDHYSSPRGKHHFLKLKDKSFDMLAATIKSDFEEAMTAFVSGAEFIHKLNGWTPDKKRKGIRKKAILQFCSKHNVTFSDLNLNSFLKLVQRSLKDPKTNANKGVKKYCESLSY